VSKNQERRCIELLVYHIDGILTRAELIFHLLEIDPSILDRFPDSYSSCPPLENTLKKEILERQNVTHQS
jgi:hypothetical protein